MMDGGTDEPPETPELAERTMLNAEPPDEPELAERRFARGGSS